MPQGYPEEDEEVKKDTFSIDREEEKEIKKLKTMIREQPNVFILNNLLMSVRLFTHYETEIQSAQKELEKQEREYNEKLLPGKVVLISDIVRQHVSGKLRLTSYQNERTVVEPLKPTQIYVVYDNVFVQELNEAREYSNPEDLEDQYTLALKEADLKGFVRLELINDPNNTGTARSSKSRKSKTPPEPVYEKIDAKPQDPEIYSPESNDSSGSSNFYEYQGSGESCDSRDVPSISQRLDQLRLGSAASCSSGYTTTSSSTSMSAFLNSTSKRSTEVPIECFKQVEFTHDGQIYNSRKKRHPVSRNSSDRSLQESIRKAELFLNYVVDYLKSKLFFQYFCHIFKDELASRMDFDQMTVSRIKVSNCSILLEKVDIERTRKCANVERHEIIPCFRSFWPRSYEWRNRKRSTWPSTEDKDYIANLQCHLVPDYHYYDPDFSDPLVKFNWSLNFPVAERYLETRLSTAQMTVYALVLAVHKNFFHNSSFGLTTSHIRHAIFWMVEDSPKWSEREMGKWMIKLLEHLHCSVQKKKMYDYFIQDRNILASVRQENLMHSQKQLKRIIDNPVMFLFHVLENIEYEFQDYPRLDFTKLLKLLVQNELVLKNPNLEQLTYERRETDTDFWEDFREAEYCTQTRQDRTLINPIQINESITEIQVECKPLTKTRLSPLLNFFAEHFLAMASSCHKLGAAVQKTIYIRQTKLLALLLADDPDWESEARSLVDRVNHQCLFSVPPSSAGPLPPETPKRNFETSTYVTDNEIYAQINVIRE